MPLGVAGSATGKEDTDNARILRGVLRKPEPGHHVEHIHHRVERLTRS